MNIKSKTLSQITMELDCNIIGNIDNVTVKMLTCDSRNVEKGYLFCCVRGTFSDGHKYAKAAVQKGASAIMCEYELEDISVPQIIVKNTRIEMAKAAAIFFDHPSEKMMMIGITGTNGKTSTTYFLKSIFEKSNKKVGIIGTICTMIGDEKIHSDRTTPDSISLQKLLWQMSNSGVEVVIMEVSSHALDQYRVHGIIFDAAEFTNITVDHLDYHKTFENYLEAKTKLFSMAMTAAINLDDPHSNRIIAATRCPVTTFGIEKKADIFAKNVKYDVLHTEFTICRGKDEINIKIPIPGRFTVYNALGAATVAELCGISWENITDGLATVKGVAGRIEPLPTYGRDFAVYLDYAHTPDALENIIKTVKEIDENHRIVTLFGCGGDRDNSKRSTMGEIAGTYSDFLIVTSDNPRTEDPSKIIEMIMEGVLKTKCPYIIIENRLEAITYALENAKKNDIIILAGKGHEDYQEINNEKHHFDEREIVDSLLKR